MSATIEKIEQANSVVIPPDAKFKYVDECGSVYCKLGLTNTERTEQACVFVEKVLGFPAVTVQEIRKMLGVRLPWVRMHGHPEPVRTYRPPAPPVPKPLPTLMDEYDRMIRGVREAMIWSPRVEDRSEGFRPYKLGIGYQGRPVEQLRLPVPKGIALRMDAICQCNIPEFFFMAWGPSKVFSPLPRRAVIDPIVTLTIPLSGMLRPSNGNPMVEHFLIGKW